MPKDYLREFDKRWPYLKNDNGVVSELKSFLTEAIKASKQEGREEAVAYIEKHMSALTLTDYEEVLEAAKEEKV